MHTPMCDQSFSRGMFGVEFTYRIKAQAGYVLGRGSSEVTRVIHVNLNNCEGF